MDKLDYAKTRHLIRQGYFALYVRALAGNWNYIAFIREELYEEKYRSYPPSSAMFKYMADYMYCYHEKKWIKERSPIVLTPAELVLYA